MEQKIKQFNETKLRLTDELKVWVLDKSIPLEKRFNIFIESDLGEELNWIKHFTPYIYEYVDNCHRYETIDTITVYESLIDSLCDTEDVADENLLSENAKEKLNEFMKDTLINFIKSLVYDW